MAIRRYQYERFCSPKGSKRAVAISSAYMLIKFSSFNVLDLPRAPPYHADKMEIEMTETAPFVRPDVALFLQFLNAVPGPRFWEVSADEARAMTTAMRDVADAPVGELAVIRDMKSPAPQAISPPAFTIAAATAAPGQSWCSTMAVAS